MCEVLRKLLPSLLSVLLLPLVVRAQARPSFTTQKSSSSAGEAVGEIFGTWWVWLGVVAIIAMLSFLFYLRKKDAD
jgi:LPXTG-motif cell wall-anchored protein